MLSFLLPDRPISQRNMKASGRVRITSNGTDEIHFADKDTNYRIFNKTSFLQLNI